MFLGEEIALGVFESVILHLFVRPPGPSRTHSSYIFCRFACPFHQIGLRLLPGTLSNLFWQVFRLKRRVSLVFAGLLQIGVHCRHLALCFRRWSSTANLFFSKSMDEVEIVFNTFYSLQGQLTCRQKRRFVQDPCVLE